MLSGTVGSLEEDGANQVSLGDSGVVPSLGWILIASL